MRVDNLELKEAIFYLTTLLDIKYISCIQNDYDKNAYKDAISDLKNRFVFRIYTNI